MREKSIRQRLLRTILGVAFSLAFVIAAVSAAQMYGQRRSINNFNQKAVDRLSSEVDAKLQEMNRQVARDISASFSERINQNFREMRENVEAVANMLGVLYGYGPNPSVQPDQIVGLMPGATWDSIRQEFSAICNIRDVIRSIPGYDPDNLDALDLYIATESGICLDGTDGAAFAGLPEGGYPDLRQSLWYQSVKGKPYYWASIFTGSATGKEKITCAVPFYDSQGRFKGAAAGDVTKNHIQDTVLQVSNAQIDYILLFNEKGELMLNPNGYPDVSGLEMTDDVAVQGDYMITSTVLKENGWRLCLIFQQEAVRDASRFVAASIGENGREVSGLMSESIHRSLLMFMGISLIAAVCATVVGNGVSHTFVRPIRKLMEEVRAIGSGQLDRRIEIHTGDEIGELADSFNDMTAELREYMGNVQRMTAERERMAAEFNVAREIQMNLLPRHFPAFPDRREFDLYADIRVSGQGGSFYDFFLIDQRRLCLVIGEASGSGIPTTMMGVIAMTHIKNYAKLGYSPSRILAETNNRLAGQNRGALTVSVFLGILNLRTGVMEYVNGGHEEPLWKASGQEFTPLKSRQCFALASMENVPYWQQELQLVQGDMLLLYTGGVVRAEDVKGNVYTETYLKQYLDELVKREISLNGIVDGLQNDLERFSEGRGQELDRTMVLLRYFG